MMKNIIVIILASLSLFAFSACGENTGNNNTGTNTGNNMTDGARNNMSGNGTMGSGFDNGIINGTNMDMR